MNGLNCSYAEFVEALNKGEVLADVRSKGIQQAMPLPSIVRQRDYQLPSYDFGHLLDDRHPDFIGEERIKAALEASGVAKVDGGFGWDEESAPASPMQKSAYMLWYMGKRRIVTATPKALTGLLTDNFEIDAFSWYASLDRWLADGGDRAWAVNIPMLCWLLLQNPEIKYEMANEPSLGAINRRQRTRGRKAFKPTNIVHIIYLTKLEKIGEGERKPHGGGSHASPIPHDRRGFTYTRKNGRQVTVRGPIAVRGGRGAATGVEYRVLP